MTETADGDFGIAQVDTFPCQVRGAASDDICDAHNLALEAWGEACKDKNSAMLAFAYLWRRFGPPWCGGDDHKSLVDYYLTTPDEQVFLWLHLSCSGLFYSVGYVANEEIREECDRPMAEWNKQYEQWWWQRHPEFEEWEETEENQRKVNELFWKERDDSAVIDAAEAAIGKIPGWRRPTKNWRKADALVRRVNEAVLAAMKELLRPVYVRDGALNILGRCADADDPASRSKYAGYAVPKEAMDALVEDAEPEGH